MVNGNPKILKLMCEVTISKIFKLKQKFYYQKAFFFTFAYSQGLGPLR